MLTHEASVASGRAECALHNRQASADFDARAVLERVRALLGTIAINRRGAFEDAARGCLRAQKEIRTPTYREAKTG